MTKLALGVLFIGTIAACGGGKDPVLIDATTVDAPEACNPLAQTGCDAGKKCAWIRDSATLGHLDCVPDGTVAVDGACMYGAPGPAGYSNCAKGTECVNAVCKNICDHNGGQPMCPTNFACSQYDGLFESADVTVAGVCDPECHPLTQELLVGTDKAACGSTTKNAPEFGCYTFNVQQFTCAGVPEEITAKRATAPVTDRQPALTPSGFGSNPGYINGCEAGYAPFMRMMTGSAVSVCVGLCAPKKSDRTLPVNDAKGDTTVAVKLWDKPAPEAGDGICETLKKGSAIGQNCTFIWPFNNNGQMFLPGPYNNNVGICRLPSQYTYDPDAGGPMVPLPWPKCETLPPKGFEMTPNSMCTCNQQGCSGAGCPDGTADEWFCYSFTETFMTAPGALSKGVEMSQRQKAMLSDFRIGGGKVKLLRHQIRYE